MSEAEPDSCPKPTRTAKPVGSAGDTACPPSQRHSQDGNPSIVDHAALEIALTLDLAERIAAELKPLRGDYARHELPNFVVTVAPTEIRDHEGKVVKTMD